MIALRATSLVVALCVHETPAYAAAPFPFCDSEKIRKELNAAKDPLSDEIRFREMDRIVQEMTLLKNQTASSEAPSGFIRNCFQRKNEAMVAHIGYASGSTQAKFDFHFIVGQYFSVTGHAKDAFDHFSRAAQIKPEDYSSQVKSYELWSRMFSEKLDVMLRSKQNISQKELDEMLSEMNRILGPLLQNPKAPVPYKVAVYAQRAEYMKILNRAPEAVADWKNILSISPSDPKALEELANFELGRNRRADARKYLEKLAPLKPTNAAVQKQLIELQLDSESYGEALTTASQAAKKIPGDLEIRALLAQALAENGRLADAEALHKKTAAAAPKNALVRRASATLHTLKADGWLNEKLPGKALAEYQAALALNPADRKLRMKMATLLFKQRQAANFQPAQASRQDMDQARKLMDPVVDEKFVEPATLEMYVNVSAHSSDLAAGAKACDRYKADFGSFGTVGLVIDCAGAYKAASKPETARRTLEDALADPRFKGTTSRIAGALSEVR